MNKQRLSILLFLFLFYPLQAFAFVDSLGTVFIENQGQASKEISYYSRIANGSISITQQGDLLLELSSGKENDQPRFTIREHLNHSKMLKITSGKPLNTRVNYFIGRKPGDWYQNLKAYQSVLVQDKRTNIDLELQLRNHSVEKIFNIKPGGDAESLWIEVTGAKPALSTGGRLALTSHTGKTLYYSKPFAYQTINGRQVPVKVAYRLQGNSYGFALGKYDHSESLVIDPIIQSTYLGGSRNDYINDIAVDPASSDVYVAGSTNSIIPGGPLSIRQGEDAFIARLSSDLKTVLNLSYIIGSGTDRIKAISFGLISGGSDIYVAGSTNSEDLAGISESSAQKTLRGAEDAFIAVLPADLSNINNSSYFGGTKVCDSALSSTTDVSTLLFGDNGSQDVLYMAGQTSAGNIVGRGGVNLPVAQIPCGGGLRDGYIAMFNRDLSSIIKSTYVGGSGDDSVVGLVQTIGRIFVAGDTNSDDFPGVDENSAQWDRSGVRSSNDDVFISRLASDLGTLERSTYFGGSGSDKSSQLISGGASLYLGGNTDSLDLPKTSGALLETPNDMFIARIFTDLETNAFTQVSYLGGSGDDNLQDLIFEDSSEDVYVVGGTSSHDLPATEDAAQEQISGNQDAFVMRLNAFLRPLPTIAKSIQTTYLGGPDSPEEIATAVAISKIYDPFAVYVTGLTTSANFPEVEDGAQFYRDGGLSDYMEGFVSVLDATLASQQFIPGPPPTLAAIKVDPDTLDFGSIGLAISKTLHLQISRSGEGILTLSNLVFDNHEAVFDITSTSAGCDSLPLTLNESLTSCGFDITFTPDDDIDYSTNLVVTSSDPDNDELNIPVTGRGINGAKLEIDPMEYDFGKVTRDILEYQRFTLLNVGNNDLVVSSITLSEVTIPHNFRLLEYKADKPYRCNWAEDIILVSGESCVAEISFFPRDVGEFSAELIVESNDIEEPSMTVNIMGEGRERRLSDGICFIATAAFGSPMQKDVVLLRAFRDKYLLTNALGKAIVSFYYETSPPIARVIAQSEFLRWLTRGLLQPLILAIKYPERFFILIFLFFLFSFVIRHRFTSHKKV